MEQQWISPGMADAEKNIKDTRRKVHTVAVMDTSLFLDLVSLQLFMLELRSAPWVTAQQHKWPTDCLRYTFCALLPWTTDAVCR